MIVRYIGFHDGVEHEDSNVETILTQKDCFNTVWLSLFQPGDEIPTNVPARNILSIRA